MKSTDITCEQHYTGRNPNPTHAHNFGAHATLFTAVARRDCKLAIQLATPFIAHNKVNTSNTISTFKSTVLHSQSPSIA